MVRRLVQAWRMRWLERLASQFQIADMRVSDGCVLLQTDLALDVILTLSDDGVRITGFPRLAFNPRSFPYSLFAAMLVRNSEASIGAWQITAGVDEVICSFTCMVPYRWATTRVTKRAVEATLSEVHAVAIRYHSIAMV